MTTTGRDRTVQQLEQKEGFWYRPGTSDLQAISDTRRMFKKETSVSLGDVVLDLGAHIGTFTGRALAAGAIRVRAVEPIPDNATLFRRNIDDPRVELWEGAACLSETGEETIWMNQKKGTDSHSLIVKRGRVPLVVKAFSLAELCKDLDPTFVKIDIEGGEYLLDVIDSFPESADRLFIEFHFNNKTCRPQAEAMRAALIDDLGFRRVWGSRWSEKAWWVEEMFER